MSAVSPPLIESSGSAPCSINVELGVAVKAREVQRRDAVPVFDGGVGPFLQQLPARRCRGRLPSARGHAVDLLGIDVCPVFEKPLDERSVLRLGSSGKLGTPAKPATGMYRLKNRIPSRRFMASSN